MDYLNTQMGDDLYVVVTWTKSMDSPCGRGDHMRESTRHQYI
jgi:hypothetical protein